MITLISQRIIEKYNKKIDTLEQSYIRYLGKFGFNLIPVPNVKETLDFYLKLPVERIILTGGGDLGDEISKERDKIERKLIDFAIKKRVPVLGICRGTQMINHYFGGRLRKVDEISGQNHVAVNHRIKITDEKLKIMVGSNIEINSYHDLGIEQKGLASELEGFAISEDGLIEGLYHPKLPIAGVMWHPERKNPGKKSDYIINAFLNKELLWKK